MSRHLRVLKEAGFAEEVPAGTRRTYHVREDGLEPIRAYLEQVWGEAAERLRLDSGSGDRPGHTTLGDPDATVHLEPRLGGRIFERASDGQEIDWGEVTRWEPPYRLGYLWHIRRTRDAATDVLVHFEDIEVGSRIEHTGWQRLGVEGPLWRDANRGGWAGLLPAVQAAAEQTAEQGG